MHTPTYTHELKLKLKLFSKLKSNNNKVESDLGRHPDISLWLPHVQMGKHRLIHTWNTRIKHTHIHTHREKGVQRGRRREGGRETGGDGGRAEGGERIAPSGSLFFDLHGQVYSLSIIVQTWTVTNQGLNTGK